MKTPVRILVLLLVAGAAIAALSLKSHKTKTPPLEAPGETAVLSEAAEATPRLVDLGAGKCIPCKAMKPILDDLKLNHTHQFSTTFIDVWENPDAGKNHGVRMIPTQIFYDADGKELLRHEGFMSKEDIFKAWQELGYNISANAGES